MFPFRQKKVSKPYRRFENLIQLKRLYICTLFRKIEVMQILTYKIQDSLSIFLEGIIIILGGVIILFGGTIIFFGGKFNLFGGKSIFFGVEKNLFPLSISISELH